MCTVSFSTPEKDRVADEAAHAALDALLESLRGADFLLSNGRFCDGCDPTGEGREIAGEVLAGIRSVLGGPS